MHQKINYLIASVLYLLACSVMKPNSGRAFGSSLVLPVKGNVYPDGNYNVTINIGNPPLPYTLDIDTGSDLTWVQCDAPCQNCYPGPHPPYKPTRKNIVSCTDPICRSLQLGTGNPTCSNPKRQCDYVVNYVDSFSSLGVLMNDSVSLTLINGTPITQRLAFGCGYDQEFVPNQIMSNDGILGLGKGEPGIVTQLHKLGVTHNVVGHCLSGGGGGFLFFGDHGDIITPSSNVVWKAISPHSGHYSLGSAAIQYDGEMSDIKDLQIVFDSGSTYTYLPSLQYEALVDLILRHLDSRLQKTNDPNLPICWTKSPKGDQPSFKTISDIVTGSYFKTWALNFTGVPNVLFQMDPQNYLIVTNLGNVCLGILNGTGVGLVSMSLIGDISLQDKLVIYDNELDKVGWAPYNCTNIPKN